VPAYEVPRPFKKSLQKKPPAMQGAILSCIKQLGENPRHPGLNAHRVQGTDGVWEAYVDRGNRLTFHYEEGKDGERIIALRNHCNHDMLRRNP
jgi:hypothetical protein